MAARAELLGERSRGSLGSSPCRRLRSARDTRLAKLRGEEGLITTYSGARLRLDLDRIPLWRDPHLPVRDLWSYYAQYL